MSADRRSTWRLAGAALLTASLAACATAPAPTPPPPPAPRAELPPPPPQFMLRLHVDAAETANAGAPFEMDVVMIHDPALRARIAALTPAEWFAQKRAIGEGADGGATVVSAWVYPGRKSNFRFGAIRETSEIMVFSAAAGGTADQKLVAAVSEYDKTLRLQFDSGLRAAAPMPGAGA